jgi:hypothetical protein
MNHNPQIVWTLASLSLAISTLATAFVQLLKDLFPVRRTFQRTFLANWFSERLAARSKNIAYAQLIEAETDLIHLATGGDRSAFYDLEPPQLCGQMNSAAQIALAFPDRHPALLRFLAPEADEGDLNRIVRSPGVSTTQADAANVNEVLDARNRVTHHLQRTIDALQISMGFRWKFYVQIIIYIICFIGAFVSLFAVKQGEYTVVEAISVGIVAGFVSPVISDIAAAINRWRKP